MSFHNSASAAPSAKPNTTESEAHVDDKPPQPVRSSEFWFEDGNIIIQVQKTQFRVYRGIIARQSQVFHDMFGLPQPEGEILIEGCPIVHLDDSAQDWENLFDVLYNPEKAHKSTAVFPLPVIASLLRLGRKYELDKLYDAALGRIREELPQSLDQWEEKFGSDSKKKSNLDEIEVELLNLLLEFEIQSQLPVAYLLCLQKLTLKNIFQLSPRLGSTGPHLSFDSIETLVLSRDTIYNAVGEYKFGWVFTHDSALDQQCQDRQRCQSQLLVLMRLLSSKIDQTRVGYIFVRNVTFMQKNFCAHCAVVTTAKYEAGRQKLWEELPTYFGLPAWNDIQ